tara:strand:- start:479 stop:679 length:201 start_codon:yes stop_codon:yes gene_type:complete
MQERALAMVMHSVIIGVVLYFGMVHLLKQKPEVAETRSVLLGGLVLVYMVVFGHGLPNKLNPHLRM